MQQFVRPGAIDDARQVVGLLLIAGKGHEDYQEIAGVKYPFSDIQVAQEALHEIAA
jgi:UDP-N-acetylmuramoyl-L-alanyl-D-glutamate--2,6-diaminopimelate ligase